MLVDVERYMTCTTPVPSTATFGGASYHDDVSAGIATIAPFACCSFQPLALKTTTGSPAAVSAKLAFAPFAIVATCHCPAGVGVDPTSSASWTYVNSF